MDTIKRRYSDAELEEFRAIILGRLETAKADYAETMKVLTNQDTNDVDDTSPTYKALEVELTDDLRREGMARELINRIQNLRKESGLEITDRIVVSIDPHKETDEALETFGDLVRQQVLANEIVVKPTDGDEIDLGDFTTHIEISKA